MKKIILILAGVLLMSSCQKEAKTAFVKTETIFKEYKGVKAQEALFKKKQEAFNKKYQSIIKDWQKQVTEFQQKVQKMSPKNAKKVDQELYMKQQQIQQMQQQESAKLSAEMQKQTDSIIKHVYDFMDKYGKDNGYKYIYGKNSTGALMYGDAQNDITDAVLKALDADFDAKNGTAKADTTKADTTEKTEKK